MDDHRVYVPLQGEHFISIARDTGETAWTADIESAWPPLVHDGVVYIAASDELHALDAASGEHKWRVPMGRGPMAALAMTEDTIVGLVAPDEVWAFRRTDGQRLWVRALGGTVGPASMAIDGNRIFVAIGSRLVRVALGDGAIAWDRTLPGMLKAPVAYDGRVFVASTANALHAVSQNSGAIAWSYPTGADVIGAAVDGNMVYVTSLDNVLRALKQGSGGQVWKKPLTTRPTGPPRVAGGVVAVSGLMPPLSTFNAKTGAPIATFDASGRSAAREVSHPGVVLAEADSVHGVHRRNHARWPSHGSSPGGDAVSRSAPRALFQRARKTADQGTVRPRTLTDVYELVSAGCRTAARRRTPSSMRSTDGAENDSRIVS
jgi:outer membrane protein assembly factor BamB